MRTLNRSPGQPSGVVLTEPLSADVRPLPIAVQALLGALSPRLRDSLVPHAELHAMEAFAAPLPPCWDWVMLETRLGPEGGPVDLLVSVTEAGTGRAVMHDALRGLTPEGEMRLAGALPLLRAWVVGEPPLDIVGVVFLEWDAPLDAARGPLVFSSIDRNFWRADDGNTEHRTNFELLRWALAPGSAAPEWTLCCEAVRTLLGTLPEHAFCLFVVSLAPRGHDGARVFIRMNPRQVGPWLDEIGWPGDNERVVHWVQALYRPWETAFLQVELTRESDRYVLGPYLGLEPSQTTASYRERTQRARWLDVAMDAGIVAPERARAVLDWPDAWIDNVGGHTCLICTSYHLKLVVRDGRESAKAYLGAHARRT